MQSLLLLLALAMAPENADSFLMSSSLCSSVGVKRTCTAAQASRINDEEMDVDMNMNVPSRRSFLTSIGTAAVMSASIASTFSPAPVYAAGSTKDSLVADLNDAYEKLSTVPDLLRNSEWDKVRTILKTPPIVQLWNLGDSKNTLVTLAKETGDFELLEMKDELSISLQMCDQYTYDNVFVYFQPGNGKVKVKEPVDMAEKGQSQLKEVIDFVGASK